MGKVKLGMTPAEIEAEQLEKERKRVAQVKEEADEKTRRTAALVRVQKRNTIIIFAVAIFLTLALLVFGTYNTFFKHVLNLDDVSNQINKEINKYPADGLDNYVRNVCEPMFLKYVVFDRNEYDWIDVDESTVYISRVRKISNSLAEVYFSADVIMKPVDKKVEDEEVIERLRRNGFANVANPTPTPTEPTETTEPAESKEAEAVSKDKKKKKKKTTKKATPTPTETTVETTPSPTPTPIPIDGNGYVGKIESKDGEGTEEKEYYIVGNGTIYEKSKPVTVRYNFYLPVEFYSIFDTDGVTQVASGYRPASDLNFYLLNDVHQESDFDNITENQYYVFKGLQEVDEDTLNSAKIKVDNILNALYSGRDTSQDFYNYRTFNTFGATYVKMLDFKMYEGKNAMGYNATVEYTVKTTQGFQYQINAYLLVEPVGSGQSRTWKITKIT